MFHSPMGLEPVCSLQRLYSLEHICVFAIQQCFLLQLPPPYKIIILTHSPPIWSVVVNPVLLPNNPARFMLPVNLCTNRRDKRHEEMLRSLTSSSATQVAEQMLVSFHTESRSTDRRAVSSSCSSCTDRKEARKK
jgi:hypothetical protein